MIFKGISSLNLLEKFRFALIGCNSLTDLGLESNIKQLRRI